MTKEQKLSQFILGLEGQLAEEVNALCPISLADALICAKSKLTSFQVGDRKQTNPFPSLGPYQPVKINSCSSQISPPLDPATLRPFVQQSRVNALPVNQSGRQIQCFECHQFGHKRADCPNKNNRINVPRLPLAP